MFYAARANRKSQSHSLKEIFTHMVNISSILCCAYRDIMSKSSSLIAGLLWFKLLAHWLLHEADDTWYLIGWYLNQIFALKKSRYRYTIWIYCGRDHIMLAELICDFNCILFLMKNLLEQTHTLLFSKTFYFDL